MANDGKRREEQRRGELARQVLDNEIYQEAIATLAHHYRLQWENSQPEEKNKREHCWRMAQCIKEFHGLLNETMRTGQMAQDTQYQEE